MGFSTSVLNLPNPESRVKIEEEWVNLHLQRDRSFIHDVSGSPIDPRLYSLIQGGMK